MQWDRGEDERERRRKKNKTEAVEMAHPQQITSARSDHDKVPTIPPFTRGKEEAENLKRNGEV